MKLKIMHMLLALAAAVFFAAPDARAATERYNVDLDHSIVGFSVAHMVVSKTTGRFTDYAGFIEMDPEAKTVKALEAVIQTGSVNTNHAKRDAHLKTPDFFNVEKFPTMTWKMKSYEKHGDKYMAKGDLTLLDDHSALDCLACGKRYRIEDDIPILLAEESGEIPVSAPGARS